MERRDLKELEEIKFIEVQPPFLSKCLGAIFGSLVTAITVPLIENPLTQVFNLMRSDITFGTMLKNILLWPFSPLLGLVHGGRVGAEKGLIEGLFAGGDAIPFFINYKGHKERTTGVAFGSTLLFAVVTGLVLWIVLTAYFDPATFISFVPEIVKFVQQWFGEALANFISGLNYIGVAAIAGAATLVAGSVLMLIGIYGAGMGEKDLKEAWDKSHLPSSPKPLDQPQVHDISDFSKSFGYVFCGIEPREEEIKKKEEPKEKTQPRRHPDYAFPDIRSSGVPLHELRDLNEEGEGFPDGKSIGVRNNFIPFDSSGSTRYTDLARRGFVKNPK